jgi:hypothetical protein
MNLFNIFRRKKPEESIPEESIPKENVEKDNPVDSTQNFSLLEKNPTVGLTFAHYHEDRFNQVEFLPSENLSYLKEENEKIEKFAEDNFDGQGFTDIYVREENPTKITSRNINFKELDKMLLELGLKKITEVYEGFGSTKWRCENTFVYRYSSSDIFVSVENEFVQAFWIDDFRFHNDIETKNKLEQILFKIGSHWDLILNDWDLTVAIDLKDNAEIRKYLDEEF